MTLMLTHTDLQHLPINVYAWLTASLTLYFLAARSFLEYRRSGNNLSWHFFWTWLFWATGSALYTLPVVFGLNERTLASLTIVADCSMYIGFLMQARLLW